MSFHGKFAVVSICIRHICLHFQKGIGLQILYIQLHNVHTIICTTEKWKSLKQTQPNGEDTAACLGSLGRHSVCQSRHNTTTVVIDPFAEKSKTTIALVASIAFDGGDCCNEHSTC